MEKCMGEGTMRYTRWLVCQSRSLSAPLSPLTRTIFDLNVYLLIH